MPTVETVKQVIATQKPVGLGELIRQNATELGRALPAHMNPERIMRIALTCVQTNPKLAQCTPASFMGSLFALAQIGLEPIAGRAYLLPFSNNRKINNQWVTVNEVQALIGYKGYIDLFYRHDSALAIDMQTVYEKDEFSFEYGTNSFLKHRPALRERGAVIGYYAVAKLKGGAYAFRFMTKDDALEHGRQHSKTYDSKIGQFNDKSPWATEPDAMCMKTVLLQLAKVLPISMEIQKAISIDETSRDYRQGVEDAVALPSTTNWDESRVVEATSTITNDSASASSTTSNDKVPISEDQRRALLALANSKGHAKEHVNKFLLEKYAIDSTTKLPMFLLEEIRRHYNSMPDVPAGF